jgi:hypothetical protein
MTYCANYVRKNEISKIKLRYLKDGVGFAGDVDRYE